MTDTPEHIKALQLKIWLSRPPEERLKQALLDNEAIFRFWKDHRIASKHYDFQKKPEARRIF